MLAGALGDSDQPTVFNTGQVIFGWVRAYRGREATNATAPPPSAPPTGSCDIMDDDGCWRQFGSPMTGKQINTYNTRRAWSLARVFEITGERRYLDAAVKNAEWALTQRNDVGWLAQNCLQDSAQPFTHTIAYAMRGLLEIGAAAQREDLIQAARVIGDAMIANLPANGFLPGRFNDHWQPTVKWSCLTGDCQLGINWGRLFQITGEAKYKEATSRVLSLRQTHAETGRRPERARRHQGIAPDQRWLPSLAISELGDQVLCGCADDGHGKHR